MLYTFYEDMNDYRMAALEYQKVEAERLIEATNKRIEKKDRDIASYQSSNGNDVAKSATTSATISFSNHF